MAAGVRGCDVLLRVDLPVLGVAGAPGHDVLLPVDPPMLGETGVGGVDVLLRVDLSEGAVGPFGVTGVDASEQLSSTKSRSSTEEHAAGPKWRRFTSPDGWGGHFSSFRAGTGLPQNRFHLHNGNHPFTTI